MGNSKSCNHVIFFNALEKTLSKCESELLKVYDRPQTQQILNDIEMCLLDKFKILLQSNSSMNSLIVVMDNIATLIVNDFLKK